jgi:hypothetical protein
MKRLLEESTDELERELLEAGAEHRPPARNQAKLLVALGVGGALGFLGSKASAWLWTTAGKLTLLSVALCTVGAIYAVTRSSALLPTAAFAPAMHAVDTRASAAVASDERHAPPEPVVSGAVSRNVEAARPLAGSSVAPAPVKRMRRALSNEPVRRAVELPSTGSSTRAGLDAEVALVDELRVATARKDWLLAQQLIERHRVRFPAGQLAQEVAELAAQQAAPARR